MPDVKRKIKLVTTQRIISQGQSADELPMREWSVELYILRAGTEERLPATCFDKVTYLLHESFEDRATQVVREAPFRIQEKGWGEFVMRITVTPIGNPKGGDVSFNHDLNFGSERYENEQDVNFRNPKNELAERLAESASPQDGGSSKPAPKKKAKIIDMEKLATGLEKLSQDDLLHVVQLIHDNKSEDTYTKNDVDNGEFHVDLCTLPDPLIKMLWDFVSSKVDLSL